MATKQFSLFGSDDEPLNFPLDVVSSKGAAATGYSLFFAIFPQREDALRLAKETELLRAKHGFKGLPLAAERLHVSLYNVVPFASVISQAVVDAAIHAADGVNCPPLPLTWDRIAHYPNGRGVLLFGDSKTNQLVSSLQKALDLSFKSSKPKGAGVAGNAHVTLLYEAGAETVQAPLPSPITWTASRFALVISHKGVTHHQVVREWPLVGEKRI